MTLIKEQSIRGRLMMMPIASPILPVDEHRTGAMLANAMAAHSYGRHHEGQRYLVQCQHCDGKSDG
eukprot:466592-Rhodomonas_salina.2